MDVFHASGAGGQHINKTSSAVRLTHLPTGIVVSCQVERSQFQNRDRAMAMLKARLADLERQKREDELAGIRGEQQRVGFGSQIRSYVMQPYQMVKDLRTEHEAGNVQGVLDGDLDPFMEAYLQWRRATVRLTASAAALRNLIATFSAPTRWVPRTAQRALVPSPPPMIKLESVSKIYKGDVTALSDASVDIEKGEFVFLVGASGSGKSTFLRLVNKEEEPERGRIFVAGKDIGTLSSWKVPYLRRNIGSVFQDFKLLTNKTVYENVAFALEVIGRPRHVVKTQVPAILELVGLAKKMAQLPQRALRRRAAAGVHRPRLRQPAADPPRRRAHRQPRPGHVGGHHAPARPHQSHRHHGGHGHPRPLHRRHHAPPRHRAGSRLDHPRPEPWRLRVS